MTASANDSKIPTGTILVGKYKVSREIGRGGMAAVYEAEHLALAKKVAIKVLAAELTASKIVSERFFREARAAASVKSPHIVDVYDSGRLEDGRPFIVMELLEGESLYDRMASIRLIPPKDTAKIIQDCAKGLAKAHSAGIVHRDLKPENIFILKGEDGKELCKILDFGLAKFYSPVQPGDEKTARLTREGAVFGTPAYMSPEQVKGQGNVDHRADLWALGCMAYECLTGRPVWNTEQGVAMTFAAIATEQLPVPSEVYPDLPIGFDAWFRKALERDVEKRFQNAIELADSLIVALGSPSGTSLPALRASSREVNAIRDSAPSSREQPHLDSVTQIALPPSDHSLKVLPAPTPRESPPEGTAVTPREAAKPSTLRYALGGVAMLASFGAAGFTWMRFLGPQVSTPVVASTATPLEPTTVTSARPLPATEEFKWSKTLADAQRALTAGDSGAALRKFAEAEKLGAGGIAKGLAEQAAAASKGRGTCQVKSLSHPRGLEKSDASRPTILALTKGALVAWTDNHEQASQEHVYSVLIDEAGVPLSSVRDLSPEGGRVLRPVLYPADDKIALFYWDTNGKGAGVNARILDAEGHIDDKLGEAKLVASGKVTWPAYETTPTGFGVVWGDERDGNADLFFRKLGRDLGPDGREVRLTDYVPAKNHTTHVRIPALTIAANALLVAYRLDRDKGHSIYRMRVSLAAPELSKGLDEKTEAGRQERELGDTQVLQEDRGDSPSVACGTEGCFVAWQDEPKGAHLAMIDSIRGKKVWAKTFAPNGTRPSLAVGPKGDVAVAFFEAGQVRIAPVSRDGVGTPSNFAKVAGDITRPDTMRPTLAPGKTRGEWFVGWLDEVPHGEVYVARLVCPR